LLAVERFARSLLNNRYANRKMQAKAPRKRQFRIQGMATYPKSYCAMRIESAWDRRQKALGRRQKAGGSEKLKRLAGTAGALARNEREARKD
jgi:hypothetical protein